MADFEASALDLPVSDRLPHVEGLETADLVVGVLEDLLEHSVDWVPSRVSEVATCIKGVFSDLVAKHELPLSKDDIDGLDDLSVIRVALRHAKRRAEMGSDCVATDDYRQLMEC